MASKSNFNLLLLAAILASIFAAAAALSPFQCYAGFGLPFNPLEGCREYVAQQACGVGIPGSPPPSTQPGNTPMDRCCEEFRNISKWCSCEAVRYFIGRKSNPDASVLKELPGCPKEPQRDFAKVLPMPGQCDIMTVHNAKYCLGMDV